MGLDFAQSLHMYKGQANSAVEVDPFLAALRAFSRAPHCERSAAKEMP
jgi:hypothetical protein